MFLEMREKTENFEEPGDGRLHTDSNTSSAEKICHPSSLVSTAKGIKSSGHVIFANLMC